MLESGFIINMFPLTPVKASLRPIKICINSISSTIFMLWPKTTIIRTLTCHNIFKKFKLVRDSFMLGKVSCYIISDWLCWVLFEVGKALLSLPVHIALQIQSNDPWMFESKIHFQRFRCSGCLAAKTIDHAIASFHWSCSGEYLARNLEVPFYKSKFVLGRKWYENIPMQIFITCFVKSDI